MLTIVLSGPRASESQARTALASAGLTPHPTDDDHGLAPHPSGEDVREPQSFVTVHGEDVNAAVAAVRPLGWALRMHHDAPEELPPTPEQRVADELAALRRRVEELEAR